MKKEILLLVLFTILCSSFQKPKKKKATAVPACIQQLINKFRTSEKENPPKKIYRYSYNGKTVYYVTAPCCDFFTDLYDSNCTLIAHPDGGFTGKGDGKAKDFLEKRKNQKLIWKDNR